MRDAHFEDFYSQFLKQLILRKLNFSQKGFVF